MRPGPPAFQKPSLHPTAKLIPRMKTISLAQHGLPKDSLAALAVLTMALTTFTPARANFDNDNDGDDFTFNLVRSAAAMAANALRTLWAPGMLTTNRPNDSPRRNASKWVASPSYRAAPAR